MTGQIGRVLGRRLKFGGAISGYILLVATAAFLVNVIYQSVQFQAFDGVVAAMIGAAAVYSIIALVVIVSCTHPADTEATTTLGAAESRSDSPRLIVLDDNGGVSNQQEDAGQAEAHISPDYPENVVDLRGNPLAGAATNQSSGREAA
jgi:hypothetical protein